MGDPKKRKKLYDVPKKIWDKNLLEKERILVKTYGLKNKKELWKFETVLKNKRKNARDLLALNLDERLRREKELVESLKKLGLLNEKSTLEDVLGLSTEALLERRLQTIVLKKGIATSTIQARQFIVHGHISIDGKKVSKPSYLVLKNEENKIGFYGNPVQFEAKKQKHRDLKKTFEEALPKKAEAEEKVMAEEASKAETAEKMENENATEAETSEKMETETAPEAEEVK